MSHSDYKNVGTIETRMMEECGELIQAICKAERFGLDNYHPDDPPEATNEQAILAELVDVERLCKEYRLHLAERWRKNLGDEP